VSPSPSLVENTNMSTKTNRPTTAGRRPSSAYKDHYDYDISNDDSRIITTTTTASTARSSHNRGQQSVPPFAADIENILSSMIDEAYIVASTGIKDISRIEYISLQIDSNLQSLLDLSELLPSLKHLVLDNSSISSIRDLGVGLRGLVSLSLSGCGLHDLDGIGVLQGLQELCLTDNYIADITPLTMHDQLQVGLSLSLPLTLGVCLSHVWFVCLLIRI
jgi:Leucine-rich repeat (LRR) protein